MNTTWNLPEPATPLHWRLVAVLLDADEPLVATFVDATGASWFGVACDRDAEVVRWVLVPAERSMLRDLARGTLALRAALLVHETVWVVDVRAAEGFAVEKTWHVAARTVPDAVLPDPEVTLEPTGDIVDDLVEFGRALRAREPNRERIAQSLAELAARTADLAEALTTTGPETILTWLDELEADALHILGTDEPLPEHARLLALRIVEERERWQCILTGLGRLPTVLASDARKELDKQLRRIDVRGQDFIRYLVWISPERQRLMAGIATIVSSTSPTTRPTARMRSPPWSRAPST